ncbi:unnamed protein product [Rotaria sordida]|uniref:TRAF1-6 MATH domain-containing protein n=1 Tax=Rotaria sordida TaxID=392033 RepID=A0A819K4S1_9BILA|nr:unnamed protein product [Rotaria sordida]
MDTDILRTTTVLDDDFALNQLDEFPEAISMFANSIETLNKDVQCLNTELLEYQNKLQHLKENASNVTFCLYDQTSQQRHIIDSFRSDIQLNSFQRPRSEVNIASYIPKFFLLIIIQQEDNLYIPDDTIFIKIIVDFGDIPKTLLPFVLNLIPGLPTNVQQSIIKQEIDRRAHPQIVKQQ